MKVGTTTGLVLAMLTLFSTAMAVEQMSAEEKQKRKIVSRFYQLTEGALAQCPEEDHDEFRQTLQQLENTYPELLGLVHQS